MVHLFYPGFCSVEREESVSKDSILGAGDGRVLNSKRDSSSTYHVDWANRKKGIIMIFS